MAGKLSSKAQVQLAKLAEFENKAQHVYGLVERFAAARGKEAEALAMPLKRAFGRLKIELMGAGMDSLSQLAGAMEVAAGRGGSQHSKSRILREGVTSIKFQLELEQRTILRDEADAAARSDADDAS